MAETYGFFDSENHDRPYTSAQMSQYFQGIVTNGVFDGIGKNLVPYISGPYVKIPSGRAVVDCHWYNNDDTVALNFPITSGSVRCILVLACDYIQRRIYPEIKQGTSVNLPDITDTENIKYLKLANLQISSSTATVTKVCIGNETPLLKNLTEYVVKEEGKGLSTNDFTDAYKSQVDTNKSDISALKSKTDVTNTNLSNLSKEVESKANSSDVYTKSETDSKITSKVSEIVAGAPEDFDTLKEMSDWLKGHENSAATMNTAITQNAEDIKSLEGDISVQKATNTEHLARIEENAKDITGLDVRLTQAEDKVTNNIQNIANIQKGIEDNYYNKSYINTEFNDVNTDISKKYSELLAGLNGISGAVTQNAEDIEALESVQKATNTDIYARIRENASNIAINKTTLGYQKKNLLKQLYPLGHTHSNSAKTVTWIFNGDYSISMTVTTKLTSGQAFEYSNITLKPGTYIYSVEGYSTPNIVHTQLYVNGAWSANLSAVENTITVTEEAIYSFRLYRNASVTAGITETLFPMLRHADVTDDTFEPYVKSIKERFENQSLIYSNTTGGSSPLTLTVSNLFADYLAVICNITTSSGNYSVLLPLGYVKSLGTSTYYEAEGLLFYYVDDSTITIRTGLAQSNPTISNVKIIGLY